MLFANGHGEGHREFANDKVKRDRAIEATAVDAFVDAMSGTMVSDKEMLQALRKAPHIPEFDNELKRRFIVGCAVGKVILEMICDPAATLKELFENAQGAFNRDSRPVPIQHVQKNWWPRLRPVSHLWAALYLSDLPTDKQRFPCTLTEFPEFLATAEYIRHLAEKRRLASQGDEKLLGFGIALAVPPSVSLPFPRAIGSNRELWHIDRYYGE